MAPLASGMQRRRGADAALLHSPAFIIGTTDIGALLGLVAAVRRLFDLDEHSMGSRTTMVLPIGPGDDAIDGMLLYCAGGLSTEVLGLLGRVDANGAWAGPPLRVAALGVREELDHVPQLRCTDVWTSFTPYLPLHRGEVSEARELLRYEVEARDLPTIVDLEIAPAPGPVRLLDACSLRLRFSKPVRGPLALGRLAELGLGQLVPADDP